MKFEDWGLVDYNEAVERQYKAVEEVQAGGEERIIFCSHPAVVTLGRSSKPEDLQGWQGEVVETSRGGRATYHGPNQLVIYPIINISNENRKNIKPRDVHAFLRSLESVLVTALTEFGIDARGGLQLNRKEDDLSYTGVWVGEQKIASIGIGVKKWVTYHGVALNLFEDENAFSGITPCGFTKKVMTSVHAINPKINLSDLNNKIQQHFKNEFS